MLNESMYENTFFFLSLSHHFFHVKAGSEFVYRERCTPCINFNGANLRHPKPLLQGPKCALIRRTDQLAIPSFDLSSRHTSNVAKILSS